MDYADRYPGNEPGESATLFADPEQYPPALLGRERRAAALRCSFGDGELASYGVLGYDNRGGTCLTLVCKGHRDAVVAREVSWIS